MIDTDGSHSGTYRHNGDTVTLTFFNGEVVYSGTYSEAAISGSARNTQTTWQFSVKRQ